MSKLIGRARTRFINAKNSFNSSKTDADNCEYFIDDCCFNIQQSMEFCLKGIVEMQGKQYVTNHDLRAQLNKITITEELIKVCDLIRTNAALFNSWETDSRYKDSFVATVQDIELGLDICKQLLDYCDSLVAVKLK